MEPQFTNSGAGWPFMSASLMLFVALRMLPIVVKCWRCARPQHPGVWVMLRDDSECRMSLGFLIFVLGGALFATTGYVRTLIIQAGQWNDLHAFTQWARWWIMPLATLAACFGSAMFIWDGMGNRGKAMCLVLVAFCSMMFVLGDTIDAPIIRYIWG